MLKNHTIIVTLLFLLFSNNLFCLFGSKEKNPRANTYITMYMITNPEEKELLEKIEDKKNVNSFLNNEYFIKNSSLNVFKAAYQLAQEKNKNLEQRLLDIIKKKQTNN